MTEQTDSPPPLVLTGDPLADSKARHAHFAELVKFHERPGAGAPAAPTLSPGAAPTYGGSTPPIGHPVMRELAGLVAGRKDADGKRLAETSEEHRATAEAMHRAVAEGREPTAEEKQLLTELRSEAASAAELDAIGPDEYRIDALRLGDDVIEVDRRSPLYRTAAAQAYKLGLDDAQFRGMLAVAVAWEQALHGEARK